MIRLTPSFSVRLSPATSLDVIDAVWPLVAAGRLPRRGSDHSALRLFVRRNASGQVLLYVADNQHGPGTPPAVLTTAVDAARAARRLADRFSVRRQNGDRGGCGSPGPRA